MITELPTQPPKDESPESDVTHIAVILVSNAVLFQQLGIPFDLVDTQGQLRDAGVFARIKEEMLLPESYAVIALIMRQYHIWWVGIESPDLPPVKWGEEPPEMTPIYTREFSEEGDTVRLTKILLEREGQDTVNLLVASDEQRSRKLKGLPLVRSGESDDGDRGDG